MDVQAATELGREALSTALLVGAPVLCVGVIVGLLIGISITVFMFALADGFTS